MLTVRGTRFYKLFAVAFVAVILLMTVTRLKISETVESDEYADEDIYLTQKMNDFSGRNKETDISKNYEETIASEQDPEVEVDLGDAFHIPFDEGMPGAYLRFSDPAPTNKSYCKYNYDLPYDLVYTKKDYLFGPQLQDKSEYRIIYNVTEAYDIKNVTQVTYASHMTANFAYFIPQMLKQWEGLITIAAFVPDLDVAFFMEQINQYCYCEPEMHRVSVHIVTHKTLPFSKKDIYFDRPDNCIPEDSSRIAIYKSFDETVIYPINVLRNVARVSALTKYVLLSDIELMPSKGLASGFLNMLQTHNKSNPREVYVVPIFEVEETETVPENKMELLKLLEDQRAVYFHGMVCKHCQRFPGLEDWVKSGYSEEIKPLVTVKRQGEYFRWEPIFIGTNAEPLYSETLSWEGLQDKMTQSLEMCMQDYNYTILDNAFLCHWPGIKKQKLSEEEWRVDFVEQNKIAYKAIIQDLQQRYPSIAGCNESFVAVLPTRSTKNER